MREETITQALKFLKRNTNDFSKLNESISEAESSFEDNDKTETVKHLKTAEGIAIDMDETQTIIDTIKYVLLLLEDKADEYPKDNIPDDLLGDLL